jgi:general secretion pathway protein D
MNSKFNKITTASYILVSLMLSSCELLNPPLAAKIPLPPIKKDTEEKAQEAVFVDLQNKKPVSDSKAKNEFYPGTDRFVANASPKQPKSKASGEGSYSLNFDDADLGEVAKVILGDILGQNYVLSPKVAGKVTLQTTEALTKEELLPTLEMVLRMNNAALVKDGKIYHIEPAADALYTSTLSTAGRPGYQTRVFPIRNVSVGNIADVLKPLVHDKTILSADAERNMLIASGTADEMSRVQDLINTFDIDVLRGRSFGVFPLTHVEPDTLIKELEDVFSTGGKEEGDFFRFLAVDRLNAIMAITHQASYLKDIENWIFRLDRANTASSGGVNVYKVQNVDAEDLASTLSDIFTGSGGTKKDKSAKVAPGQTAAEISNKQPAEKQKVQKTSSAASKQATPSGDSPLSNVKIIADATNNSIIIVATPQEYETILPVIKQLDAIPLQVLIDATVVSVKLTNNLQYGISWYLSQGNDSVGGNKAGATALGTAAAAALAASTGGLSAVYSSGSIKALLNAEAAKGNVNVISSPSLMVLNNQQAKINVGDQVPIQTGTLGSVVGNTATTGATTAIQSSIQYKDTGVTLDVKPRVNANGMVIMEIKQIVSTPVSTSTGVSTTPTIQKKEIESFVAVKDGETIVLGGLIDDSNTANKSGIPFLYDLPWIGPLFGKTEYIRAKNELVVLITPRVVKNKQDSRVISDEFKRKLTGIYQPVPEYIERKTTK